MSFIDDDSRDQISLLPSCIDDYVAPAALVRVVDAFVASLDLVGQASSPATCSASTYRATSTRSDHRGILSARVFETSKPCA